MSTLSTVRTDAPARLGLPFAVMAGCQLMIGLDATVVTVALPRIGSALSMSTATLSWVQNAYLLAFGGLLLCGGRAGDLFGRRRVFAAGVAVFTLASLAGGLAGSAPVLLAARAVQGAGAAMAGPSVLALIATTYSGELRTRALSIYSAMAGGGGAAGLLLGGALTGGLSWRWVFFLNLPVGAAVLVLAPRVLPETERHTGRLDVAGAVLGTLGVSGLVYGLIRAASDGWGDPGTLAALAVAAVLLAVFVRTEARSPVPLMPLDLFASRLRAGAFAVQVLITAAMFGSFFFLTQYLQIVRGYGPWDAGLAFLPIMSMQFALVRFAPRLIARFGPLLPVVVGGLLMVVSIFWYSRLPVDAAYFRWLLVPMLLTGTAGGLAFLPLTVTVLGSVPPERSGAASGVAQTMLWGGASLGTALMVNVASAAGGSRAHGLSAGFTVAAVLALAALPIAAATIRRLPM